MKILLFSDGRPGHYHLAEGVIAAIERVAQTHVTRLQIKRRALVPTRLLRTLLKRGVSPKVLLSLGYGIDPASLPQADIVISAGGETLIANIAAAKLLGAPNIFCGSLRKVAPQELSLVITSYERFAHLPNHLAVLKPNVMDPDALGRPAEVPKFGQDNPPNVAGLLIGGNSGLFTYTDEEWTKLLEFARQLSDAWGTKWLISTSRRTPEKLGDKIASLASGDGFIREFIDYRNTGPGSLGKIFATADIILCSEDSSTMISEAICARLPVIGLSPAHHSFKPEEAEYREFLHANNWCRYLSIAGISVERFEHALGEITPLKHNHLEELAGKLKERLPALFSA